MKLLRNKDFLNLTLTGFLTLSLLISALTINSVRSLDSEAKGKPSSTTKMTVSPNPAPIGTETLNISGTGFGSNQLINLTVAGSFPAAEVTTDSAGNFAYTWVRWGGGFGAGDQWVTATKSARKPTTLAVAYFTVCSTNPCQ